MFVCLSFIICRLSFSVAHAQVGSWHAYISYHEPQQIVKAGNVLFVRASNGLYSYNLVDHSITTFDKVNTLSDSYITDIAWNADVRQLLIVYQNSNLDLLDRDGNVTNINAIYSKSMTQDKTVNSIYLDGIYAYLSTGFGIVKLNMERAEVSETYILNENITATAISGSDIFARTADGRVFFAPLSKNLIDPHSWTAGQADSSLFTRDTSDWTEYLPTVQTLQPGGPKYNYFGFLKYKYGRLYTSGGGTSDGIPGTIQVLDGDEWQVYQDDVKSFPGAEAANWSYVNVFAVDVDPLDHRHVFAASRTGLWEFYDGQATHYYNKDNSLLQTATTSNRYVIVEGLSYDADGNLWLLQSQTSRNSIVEITKDGEWVLHPQSQLMDNGLSLGSLRYVTFDSRGLMWFINAHWDYPSFYCYDTTTNSIVTAITHLVNQDGTSAPEIYNPHCIAEDLDGNIWIGTLYGPYLIESERAGTDTDYATQVKVPRNDGTNYADYLLSGVNISCIAVDGGNRKWFGTNGDGLYLISSDNMEQVQHFTSKNSPLLSDNVRALTINPTTGEVFIGTDQGLCSYMSDATDAAIEMVNDDVYAYPNPVVSGYEGLITVVGLSRDADVKVLTANGQLVAQGRSNGGTFTWDGRDRQGRRVASGVYMVAAATSDGKKGVVCKIAVIK